MWKQNYISLHRQIIPWRSYCHYYPHHELIMKIVLKGGQQVIVWLQKTCFQCWKFIWIAADTFSENMLSGVITKQLSLSDSTGLSLCFAQQVTNGLIGSEALTWLCECLMLAMQSEIQHERSSLGANLVVDWASLECQVVLGYAKNNSLA